MGVLVLLTGCKSDADGEVEETMRDSAGHDLILLRHERFPMGFSGGEREMNKAFPDMTTGQYYGNAESPQHLTWITKPFYISSREVTVAQFKKFVKSARYETTAEREGGTMVGWQPTGEEVPLYEAYDFQRSDAFDWTNPGFEQEDDHPVVGVSWEDAMAYCEWLSKKEKATYRLPTEAEWEMAARAGSKTWFSWGDQARQQIHQHANIGNVELEKARPHAAERHWLLDLEKEPGDGFVFTAPAGNYEANPYGLHDMAGNVWEWCQDYFLDTAYNEWQRPGQFEAEQVAVDPVNLSQKQTDTNDFRVIRGGSWYTGPLQARPSSRAFWDETDAAAYIGFRVVREAPESEYEAGRLAYGKEQAAWDAIELSGGKAYDRERRTAYEIVFEGETFDPEVLNKLTDVGPIYRLRFNFTELSSSALAAIAKVTSLEELDFNCPITAEASDLEQIAALPNLRILRFPRHFPLTDEHMTILEELTTLEAFQAYGHQGGLTDAGVAKLAGNTNLQSLEIPESDVDGSCLQALSGLPLELLVIEDRFDGDVAFLDENAKLLTEFPNMQRLTLRSSKLTDAAIAEVGKLDRLTWLSLYQCDGISDGGFAPLGNLHKLDYLWLQSTQAGDKALNAISTLDTIGELGIGSENLTDAGMTSISRMMPLETLFLDRNTVNVTDAGVAELGKRLRRLTRVKLLCPNLTGEGLATFPQIESLQELTIISPQLTDVVFEHLSQCDSLVKLWLVDQDTQPAAALTNEGMFKLQRLENLRELWLPRHHTQMTEDKMLELKELMPNSPVIPYSVRWTPQN